MSAWRHFLLGVGISVVVALAYLSALPGAFHFDDYHSIVNNPALGYSSVKSIFTRPELFSGYKVPMYRPLTVLSFALQTRHGMLSPQWMILVNVALHAICTGLVFGIVRELSGSSGKAALAAVFFGLHPLQTQAVNYISCRATLLAAGFAFASLLAWLKSFRQGGGMRVPVYALSLVLFGLGLLSKSEVFALALLPFFLGAFLKSREARAKSAALAGSGFLILAGLYLLLRYRMGVDVMVPASPIRPIPANLATGARAILEYLILILWPSGISVAHDLKPSATIFDPLALAATALFIFLIALAFRHRKSSSLVFPGACWFFLGFLPTHTLAPLVSIIAEHRAYLGMAGGSLVVAEVFYGIVSGAAGASDRGSLARKILVYSSLAVILTSWTARVEDRNRIWQDEQWLWKQAAERAPGSVAAWGNLGVALWEEGKVGPSRTAFEIALKLDPENLQAMTNLGRIYVDAGEVDKGLDLLEKAAPRAPYEATVQYNLGRAYREKGEYWPAETHFRNALKIRPDYINACERLAELYVYDLKDHDEAQKTMAKCLAMRPTPEELERIKALLKELSRTGRPDAEP